MKIDRTNYEIWFIDWLDGKLDNHQIEQLKVFLDENPDLREEAEGLSSVSLNPPVKSFNNKNLLKKTPEELSASQFENFCIAFFENDLSTDQKDELLEIVLHNKDKKRTFDLISKSRLSPPAIHYKNKEGLLKRTPLQKVIRLSAIGLSAAATISLLIIALFIIPRNIADDTSKSAINNILSDSILIRQPAEIIIPEKIIAGNNSAPVIKINKTKELSQLAVDFPVMIDSIILKRINTEAPITKISAYNKIRLISDSGSKELIAFNPLNKTLFSGDDTYNEGDLVFEDDRSNVSRFFSRFFREKILNDGTSGDNPLKAYEIAEAGVTGLNKLLGWEMTLDKNNDKNGEVKSIYFSSKILKFNTPVKKTESPQ
jgi:hypothetical protein